MCLRVFFKGGACIFPCFGFIFIFYFFFLERGRRYFFWPGGGGGGLYCDSGVGAFLFSLVLLNVCFFFVLL